MEMSPVLWKEPAFFGTKEAHPVGNAGDAHFHLFLV